MGRIQSNIGLITGVPIGETVDALMALAAKPRDLLLARTSILQQEQAAVTELSALLLAVKYITDNLGKEDLYDQRDVISSDAAALAATVTGDPPLGTYQFTPLRMVQSQQLLSSGFRSDTEPIGGGRLSLRFGDHVQRSTKLELLAGGEGAVRGKIRITDRSGANAEIDLSTALGVDDVLEAINESPTINVTAVARRDGIRLIDNTGQAVSNLRVQEVGGGTTAASLGLDGIDVAGDVADGQDMLRLYDDLELDVLNDGSGVLASRVLDDIHYELRDGTTGQIDLSPIISGRSEIDEETTLGEILAVINAAEPGKLKVEIAPDGDRLVVTDLSSGSGTFELTSLYDSQALKDLGLEGDAVDGVITGRRILAGMQTVLLSSLDGGQGLGPLGALELTDRSGASDTVDLSGAETLEDVIAAIDAANVAITARVNEAQNGIELVDTTGASAGNLIVASVAADGTGTAEKLGIAVDADVLFVNGGDLHLQVVAENTKLSELDGGAGVARGTLTIIDSNSQRAQLNLADQNIVTVGDVIREINRLGLDISAELNDTGDGILIRDTGYGPATLRVEEGNTTTAADLHLLGEAVEVDFQGQPTQVIDGRTTYTIELGQDDSLDDLRQTINDLGAGLTATVFVDGSSKPFRLSLSSDRPGKAGELVFDASELDFSIRETARARDALLVFGDASATDSNVLISASSNTFQNVLSGVTLEIGQPSTSPVTVTVGATDVDLVANVQTFVDNYNQFRGRLAELTAYNAETETRSILTGDGAALRLDSELSYLLSGRFAAAGSIQSLAEVGVSLNSDGTLALDASKLKAKYAADPEAVEQFFTTDQFGVSARFDKLIESLSGDGSSLLSQRIETLQDKIALNDSRVELMDDLLDSQRERMLKEFYRMEIAIGKMRSSLSAIESMQPLAPLVIGNRT